jgi:DNA repair protein RecO (recombination protein O)
MIKHTQGIVLSSVKYAESSVVCKIYTQELGLQSYLINGVRKRRGTSSYYQPLSLLDMVVYHKEKGGLQRVKEVTFAHQYKSIPFHVLKSSVTLFLAEVLSKCLREEEQNNELFDFLLSSFIRIDQNEFSSIVHLHFLLDLSAYLGFYPNRSNSNFPFFDLINGCFTQKAPVHKHFIGEPLITTFTALLNQEKEMTISNKKALVDKLLEYYELHLDGFTNVRSHEILETVLNT